MKCSVSRISCAAVCVSLCLALGCGCAAIPPASSEPASAASIPTDTSGNPLYDASRLDDGKLRILYGYDNSGSSSTVLCGSKVLYQSSRSENVSLLQDTVTGETNYWFRSWADSTGRGGRRSALYDKDGTEVMAFDGEQSAAMQNGLLVLLESALVNGEYQDYYWGNGTCQVIDLATGESLPVPDGAYRCSVCGDYLVYTCYARPADLTADEWDDDMSLHSWIIILTKDGTQVYGADSTTALSLSYAADSLSDAAATSVVLAAMLIARLTNLNIDGWAGLAVSIFIIVSGVGAARDTVNPLLGMPPDPELVERIKREALSTPYIMGLHDLVVHDYGPGRRMITLHAEVPAEGDILLMHDEISALEQRLKRDLDCEAVIHMDPVVSGDRRAAALQCRVSELLAQSIDPRVRLHDFRAEDRGGHVELIFDVVVPYDVDRGEEALRSDIDAAISELGEGYHTTVTIDRG